MRFLTFLLILLIVSITNYGQASPNHNGTYLESLANIEVGQKARSTQDLNTSFRDRGPRLGSLRRTAARLQVHDGGVPTGDLYRPHLDWTRGPIATREATSGSKTSQRPDRVTIAQSSLNYMIYFKTVGCGACNRMAPKIKQLQQQGYEVYIASASENPLLVSQYNIVQYPTMVIFNQRKIVKTYVGVVNNTDITTYLKKNTRDPNKYRFW